MKKAHELHQEHHQQPHLALKAVPSHGLNLAPNHGLVRDLVQNLLPVQDLNPDHNLVPGLLLDLDLAHALALALGQNQSPRVQLNQIDLVRRLPNHGVRQNLHQNHDRLHRQNLNHDRPQHHRHDQDLPQSLSHDLDHPQSRGLPAEVVVEVAAVAVLVALKAIKSLYLLHSFIVLFYFYSCKYPNFFI